MYTKKEAMEIAKRLHIDFSKFTLEDFLTGINIELEHGLVNPPTNVTNDDLEMTAKIALAHLNEFSNYYNKEYGLPALEETLRKKETNNYRQTPKWKK